MKRPKQHEIDSSAKKIFCSQLPSSWVEREQSSDYGVDFELEIFDNGISTGLLAKIQLKGTTRLKIKNDQILFNLDISNVNYLLNELSLPTFLFIVDINEKNTYWLNIKSDKNLKIEFKNAIKKRKKSLTLKISINNLLIKTLEKFHVEIKKTYDLIAIEKFNQINNKDFLDFIKNIDSIDDYIKNSENNISLLHFQKLYNLIREGKYKEVIDESELLIKKYQDDNEKIFNILLIREPALDEIISQLNFDEQKFYLTGIKNAEIYLKYIPKNNIDYKYFSLVNYHSKVLAYMCFIEWGIYINSKLYIDKEDEFYKMMISQSRVEQINKIHKKYNHILRLISYQLRKKTINILFPESIFRLINSISILILRITNEMGNDIKDDNFLGHILTILDIGINYSIKNNSTRDFIRGNFSKINILSIINKKIALNELEKFQNLVKTMSDIENKDQILLALEDNKKRFSINENRNIVPNIEEEIRIYKQMAVGLGIDLNNKNDRIAQIINIGLKDLNPERVLKNCIYLFIHITSFGVPAEMLKLPTAGFKMLNCTKHHFGIESMDLDNIYSSFKQEFCNSCKDKKPHQKSWKWSREWQNKENIKNRNLLN